MLKQVVIPRLQHFWLHASCGCDGESFAWLTRPLDAAVEVSEDGGVRLWVRLPEQQEEGHGCAQGQHHEAQRRPFLEGKLAVSALQEHLQCAFHKDLRVLPTVVL